MKNQYLNTLAISTIAIMAFSCQQPNKGNNIPVPFPMKFKRWR